jgi:ribosome-binding ATPase YchF (GTP1/OBG family)
LPFKCNLQRYSEDEWELVRGLYLLTAKPCIYAANVNEDDLADKGASNDYVAKVRAHAEEEGSSVTIISAQVESELIKLDPEVRGACTVCTVTHHPPTQVVYSHPHVQSAQSPTTPASSLQPPTRKVTQVQFLTVCP